MCGIGLCHFSGLVCDLLLMSRRGLNPKAHCQKSISSHTRDGHCLEDTGVTWCLSYPWARRRRGFSSELSRETRHDQTSGDFVLIRIIPKLRLAASQVDDYATCERPASQVGFCSTCDRRKSKKQPKKWEKKTGKTGRKRGKPAKKESKHKSNLYKKTAIDWFEQRGNRNMKIWKFRLAAAASRNRRTPG